MEINVQFDPPRSTAQEKQYTQKKRQSDCIRKQTGKIGETAAPSGTCTVYSQKTADRSSGTVCHMAIPVQGKDAR